MNFVKFTWLTLSAAITVCVIITVIMWAIQPMLVWGVIFSPSWPLWTVFLVVWTVIFGVMTTSLKLALSEVDVAYVVISATLIAVMTMLAGYGFYWFLLGYTYGLLMCIASLMVFVINAWFPSWYYMNKS
jgi:hypothetical protein